MFGNPHIYLDITGMSRELWLAVVDSMQLERRPQKERN